MLGKRLFGDSFKAGRGAGGTETVKKSPVTSEVAAAVPSGGQSSTEKAPPLGTAAATSEPKYPPIPPVPVALRTIDDVRPDYQIASWDDAAQLKCLQDAIKKNPITAIAFDIGKTEEALLGIRGLAIAHGHYAAMYLPLAGGHVEKTKMFFRLFGTQCPKLAGHDLKSGLRGWFSEVSMSPNEIFDTALAHSVVFPDLRHTLAFVAESLLNYTPIPEEKASGQQDFLAEMEAPDAAQLSARRTMERADLALQLHAVLVPKLAEAGQEKIFTEIESPLLPVLAAMENEGIRLDPAALEEVGKKVRADLVRLEASIYEHAGTTFNIGSPKQLGEILFGKLVLDAKAKKTKTGQYSTDEQTLSALAPLHPIIREILDYREASKLLSTYIDALPNSISPVDKRIHTTFYQLATSTGRLNSQDPNLQNIPIRTAQGREIRRAFVPREGDYTLLSADYSQIELRILAALTQDPGLLEAITSGEDIHRATAAKVFGLPLVQVTKEQRNQAKMVNYGISYGISAFGLSQRLGIARGDAKNLIDGYFAQYPGIKQYMIDTVARAKERGYVETITGRRRYLPDVRSANATVRASAERNAINMPIQGSSADLIKIAMVQIARVAREENWTTKLLLQVHDELVFDLYLPEKTRVLEIVQDRMKNALPELKVPIVVDTGTGPNWLEAH